MSSLEPPPAAEVRTKAIVRPSGENEASCSSPAEAAIACAVPPLMLTVKRSRGAPAAVSPLEDDDAGVRRDERPRVQLGAAGQPFLPGAVGPDREDVPFADEGDRVAVGRERRFRVGGVFGQLVEVPVFDREQPAFGRFRRQHCFAFFVDAVVFGDLREDDRPAGGRGARRNGQCEEGDEDGDETFLEHRMLLSERSAFAYTDARAQTRTANDTRDPPGHVVPVRV